MNFNKTKEIIPYRLKNRIPPLPQLLFLAESILFNLSIHLYSSNPK